MRYWKTSILWICLTPWHLACFGGGGENVSMPEVLWPAIIPSRSFLPCSQGSSLCTFAALWGRASVLNALQKGSWQENWGVELPRSFTCHWWGMSCCQQVHMTLLFGSWKTSAEARAFFHRYLWGVLMQQGWAQDSWGRERFWDVAWNVLEELRRVFESS